MDRLRKCFPKTVRLRTRSEYTRLSRHGESFKGKFCWIQFRSSANPSAKLGITVTRRFGKAHERNRFKRITREAFRELFSQLPVGLEIQIHPRSHAKEACPSDILGDIRSLVTMR